MNSSFSLINLLNYTSHALIDSIGFLVILWFVFVIVFNIDLLDALFNNKCNYIRSTEYKFIEVFLYAFVFGLVATVFNDMLREYDGYNISKTGNNLIYYYLTLLLAVSTGVYQVWKKYKEQSLVDLLSALLVIPIILIVLAELNIKSSNNIIFLILFTLILICMLCYFSLVKSVDKNFSKEKLKTKISKLLDFCKKLKIIDRLYIYMSSLGFAALFFLFDNFISQEYLKFYMSKENGLYYIFVVIALLFFAINRKNRAMLITAVIPIIIGGTVSIFFVSLLKLVFLRN